MSPPSTSTPLRNAVSIFIAHFHVRRGNELVWYKGEDDLAGVEWKVLPSGSHAVEKDIIYFEAPPSPNNISRIGVAAFRNHKIAQGVRTGVGDWEEDDDQRGARMMAVGAILECGEPSTPWSLLAATLPHLSRLEGLVDAISADPSCRNLLVEWFEMHKTLHDGAKHVVERDSHLQSSFYDQDPILQLPAITNALGPLLPSLLKRLILPRFRLLLYVPPGTPTFRAAAIGFALGELAYAACQSEQVEQSSAAAQCPVVGKSIKQHGLRILGLIGLYDIAKLQNEQEEHRASQTSWIAMTTDKILLEKCDLYDAMLDLSPLATSGGSDDLLATPSALPCLMSTHRFLSKDGKPKAELKKQSWTAREFAIFRGLDEQASLYAVSSRARRRSPSGHRSSQISLPARSPPPHELSPTKHLRSQGRTSVLLAYLRFWLANMWILPYQWRFNLRESYGYVPLSIRSDGGVRASIMLLPDVESDEDDDGDDDESSVGQGEERGGEEEEDQEQAAVGESRQSPVLKRHYSGEHALSFSDEEDDPILAACGATQASSRQRKSRSHSSVSKSGSQQLDGSHDRIVSPNDLLKVPSHGGNVEQEGVQEGLKESVRLSLAIFELWSLWVKELVIEVRHLVEDKVLKEQESNEDETLQDSDTSLLQGDQRSIVITSEEIYDLRLSASILIDTQLILYLASTVTTRPIAIQQSWWSRASCLWS